MKILQVCFRPQLPANDGGAIAMYNLTKGWVETENVDLSLFVVTTQKHHIDKSLLEAEFGLKNITCSHIDTSITPIGALLTLLKNESYNISRFDKLSLKQDLSKLLKETEFDIIHFEGLFVSPLLATAKEFNPKAICSLRAHNIEHIIWKRRVNQASGIKKWYLKQLTKKLTHYENQIIEKFDTIIPITEIDEPYFKKQGCKTFVSSTGIIADNSTQQTQVEPLKVFHLGSLDWTPNIEGLEWFVKNVWGKVLTKIPDAQFYIAGKNKPENTTNISGTNIHVIGEVPNAKQFMKQHGVMIVPLLSGSGMRIKVVEGMSFGCPILSSPIGAEGIDVTHEEDIILASDTDSFAEELIRLLKNKALAIAIGESAKRNALKHYSNQTKVKELTQYYSSLLK